ncbi:amidohydrolase family protein, partial [Bacillus sp. S34]|nr:amidohydrolase family protein [Bacillus sp. S34]
PEDLARVLAMATTGAARVVGIADRYGIRPGADADLVVLSTTDPTGVLLDRPDRNLVVKRGRVVAVHEHVERVRALVVRLVGPDVEGHDPEAGVGGDLAPHDPVRPGRVLGSAHRAVGHGGDLAAEGRRALGFSQFTSFLRMVATALDDRGVGYEYLDGSTRRRPEVIDRFRNGTAPAFLISLKAGGFGLTLTEATAGTGADIRTTVRREGDTYVMNGEKHLITFGVKADY